jgi:cytochrome c-type biogenesis protein CcmH/NrfG
MASSFPDAPQFVPRLYARALEKCGDLKAAYEEWKRLWRLDHSTTEQAWSIIEREIRRLEDYLQIPNQQRVFPQSTP